MVNGIKMTDKFIKKSRIKSTQKLKILVILMSLFIFSFQVFYYFTDFFYLYISAKVIFPAIAAIISVLFVFFYLKRKKIDRNAYIILLIWFALTIVSAVMSNYYFEQSFLIGFVSQLKLAPFGFYFIIIFVLIKSQPTLKQIENSFIILAILSLVIFYFMNLFINPSTFWSGKFNNIIMPGKYSFDELRYFFPMVFVHFGAFLYFRKYLIEKKKGYLLYVILAIIYEIFFHQQRMETIVFLSTLVLVYIWFRFSSKYALLLTFFGIVIGMELLLFLLGDIKTYFLQDSSFGIRINTFSVVFSAFENDILAWFFGHGFLSPLGLITYQDLYGDNFWLSDIGWIGVIYEFGIIGMLIFFYLYFLLFKQLNKFISAKKAPLVFAFHDYTIMSILFSPLATLILYRLGVFISILAILSYLMKYKYDK